MIGLKVEKWSALHRALFIMMGGLIIFSMGELFDFRGYSLELKTKRSEEILSKRNLTRFINRNVGYHQKLDKLQLISNSIQKTNLHKKLVMTDIFLFLIHTFERNNIKLMFIRPVENIHRVPLLDIAITTAYFQLLQCLSDLKNSPWIFDVVKLKIVTNEKFIECHLQLEVNYGVK